MINSLMKISNTRLQGSPLLKLMGFCFTAGAIFLRLNALGLDDASNAALTKTLGADWANHWDTSHLIQFNGTVTYDSSGGATFALSQTNVPVIAGAAVVMWLDSSDGLKCSRYQFWLQNDEQKPGFFGKLFGKKTEPAQQKPGAGRLTIPDDYAKPTLAIQTGDPGEWHGGNPDSLKLEFSSNPMVYIARGRGILCPGGVDFKYASPDIIAKGTTDQLERNEPSLIVDGQRAGDVQNGDFKHVHRQAITPNPSAAQIHFLVIIPKPI